MRVAGVMSGTSLDGIDVAVVDIEHRRRLKIAPIAFRSTPYPKAVREALLAVSNTIAHTSIIARLNFLLGELYAAAILETCRRARVALSSIDLIGMHGQTVFHEATPVEYLGHCVSSTMQIGEAAVVAERTGITTVSNFRERDMAAGGKGAPLIPYVDQLLFHDRKTVRVALNIGGIANITILRARGDTIAFDTGPGNMVIDALAAAYSGESFDRNGAIARKGNINARLLESMLSDPYFALDPPKACGREQYGREFVSGLIATGVPLPDLIATATEMTAQSVALAIAPTGAAEVIASGGGVHNRTLMRRIAALLPDVRLSTSGAFGIDPDAKEAIGFAVLAHELIRRRPANLPSATGARRAVLLGKITPAR